MSARKPRDGSVAYRVRVQVMQDGVTYHETDRFDRRPAAAAWMKKNACGTRQTRGSRQFQNDDPTTLATVIDPHTEERPKAAVWAMMSAFALTIATLMQPDIKTPSAKLQKHADINLPKIRSDNAIYA
ncbi:hypothetical protein HGO38_03335 [Rhizobium sp. CG5]|nr:hypothetical protein [Rhizobium sp. CG5]